MKYFLLITSLIFSIIMVCFSADAEDAYSPDFLSALQNDCISNGGEILSVSECGYSGAAIVKNHNDCMLTVFSYRNGQWVVEFENKRAVREESRVYLDTDDTLILNIPMSEEGKIVDQYYFKLNTEWVLSSAIRYDGYADEWKLTKEYHAAFSDGWLCTQTVYTDENDNVAAVFDKMPLPDVLTPDERKLACFDVYEPPITGCGYLKDDSMCVSEMILQRLFAETAEDGYAYVDGCLNDDGVQFIADRADGARVLLCCEYSTSQGTVVTESTPLPAGTRMGIENFTNTLNLGQQGYGYKIHRYSNGSWGAQEVQADEIFAVGACWVSKGGQWWNSSPVIGAVPWNDVTVMDWSTIPKTLDEAKAMVDSSLWAVPNNPNEADRLHLRAEPRKGSRSLGKYYNGTPIRVLSRGDEWSKVQIGDTVGYMMTRYLLFGNAINTSPTALFGKIATRPTTEVLWEDSSTPIKILSDEIANLAIIGVIENEWFLVWDWNTDRYGRIRQSELCDGNG